MRAGSTEELVAELEAIPLYDPPAEPAAMLAKLATLGDAVDGNARLLALRAQCYRDVGQPTNAWDDFHAAMHAARDTGDLHLHRWVSIFHAEHVGFVAGNVDAAKEILMRLLRIAKVDDHAMQAMAMHVYGELVAAGDDLPSLTHASRIFNLALIQWDMLGPCARARRTRSVMVSETLAPLGLHHDALEVTDALLADPGLTDFERGWYLIQRGFSLKQLGDYDAAESALAAAEHLARDPLHPMRLAIVAWGRALVACRRGDLAAALEQAERARSAAATNWDGIAVPFCCDMSLELGAIGQLEAAQHYFAEASARSRTYPGHVAFTGFVLAARRGELGDIDEVLAGTQPGLWSRGLVAAAATAARNGDAEQASALLARAERERERQGVDNFTVIGEAEAHHEVTTLLGDGAMPATASRRTA